MLVAPGDAPDENDWVLVKDKSCIRIYSRKFSGTEIKEIQANTSVNASIKDLSAMLMDVKEFPEWMPNIRSTEILKRISNNEIFYYVEVKVPWPFTNRDNIMHIKLQENSDTKEVTISIESIPDYIPPKEGLVRIPMASGMWKFTPNQNGSSNVFLEYLADPGGRVPIWIVNMFVTDVPFKTLTKLKEVVEDGKNSK